MAEQEIAKHTKNVVRLFGNSEHDWRHKLGEMALEIITIVFAVSLSIWLHSLGDHRNNGALLQQGCRVDDLHALQLAEPAAPKAIS